MLCRRLLRCFVGGVIVNNILLWFRKYKNHYEFALRGIFAFFILLLLLALLGMLWVMASVILDPEIGADFMGYAGYRHEKDKPEFIKLIGLGISGIMATFGVIGLLWRAASLDEQNTISKKGHVYERFKTAIEHVGNENNILARIAAFNEFYYAAEIEPDLRKIIFNLLCAHLRQITKDKDYKNKIKPTEEVQSLLDILFKPRNNDKFIFDGLVADLEETNLQGANLQKAELQNANLRKANLQKAHITDANLQEAKMWQIDLRGAFLHKTNLQKTQMMVADLRGAHLSLGLKGVAPEESENANLQEALLFDAKINQDTIMPNNDWKKVVGRIDGKKIGIKVLDGEGKVIRSIDD